MSVVSRLIAKVGMWNWSYRIHVGFIHTYLGRSTTRLVRSRIRICSAAVKCRGLCVAVMEDRLEVCKLIEGYHDWNMNCSVLSTVIRRQVAVQRN